MPERVEKDAADELEQRRWSVISFNKCEVRGLSYDNAAAKMAELYDAGIVGLCLVADEAAERMCGKVQD